MKVSNSQIGCFKACRRMYELKYIHGLEPVEKPEALSRGLSYHEAVERILRHETDEGLELEPKVRAMAKRFAKSFHLTVDAVEQWFEYNTQSGHTVIGRVDATVAHAHTVVEHKTTGSSIDGAYFQRLEFDEQIPTYMLGMNVNDVVYTVCQTPTIRQKKNETDEEFEERCIAWFDEPSADGKKFAIETIHKTPEQLELFAAGQDAVINEMANCRLFYRNPSHCMKWGRLCEYASICMHYDPNMEYIEFKRREIRGNGNSDA